MDVNHAHHQKLVASQKWKLWLLGGMTMAAGLGFLFNKELAYWFEISELSVELLVLLLTFSTLAVAFWAIRCPHCRLSLVKHSMFSQSVGGWLAWLLAIEKCPRCGFSPSEQNPKNRRPK
ncbi:MAG TPA: hypothetical protein VF555_04430 [Variovorax sp.]